MPPTCGHRDYLQRRCELLQGHTGFANERGEATAHQYTDTPESLAARGGAAASDQRVTQRVEDEQLLRDTARVALADCVSSSRNCRLCFSSEQHYERCPLYVKQLETRLIRTHRTWREERAELEQARVAHADQAFQALSLEGAVADLETEQNRQSEEVRRQARQISFLEGENNRLRGLKLTGLSTAELLRELLRRETGENK